MIREYLVSYRILCVRLFFAIAATAVAAAAAAFFLPDFEIERDFQLARVRKSYLMNGKAECVVSLSSHLTTIPARTNLLFSL